MEKLFTTIWEARDSYLIILNDNGMIYHTQTGGELHDEEEAQGFLLPFPIYKNKEFCHAIISLFQNHYYQHSDQCYLHHNPQLRQNLSNLFEEFQLAELIELDEGELDKSYNQWLYVNIKAGFQDMFTVPQQQLPLKAVLTWSFNDPFVERPDYQIYEEMVKKSQEIILKAKRRKEEMGRNG
ncbi:DUF6210 family protein [Bartonella sp. HY761]|uniref:DUF6210 family protein n=1 Tax=Bartonella sp. HY761 TaxID=2979330 RepID=UPI00220BFAC0|nr:DUF6210 family protein [Bartonella sp. HY761]UXN06860.1 DUF6210 family protein [Bartonella sp. HY761]